MGKQYGGHSMAGQLKRVLVRRPDAAFGSADPKRWHYTSQPDLAAAQAEHDAFVATIAATGAEILYHDIPLSEHADAIFVRDPLLICDQGAIILRMGKLLRRGEDIALIAALDAFGIPIHATLHGDATAEGGDLLWLDAETLAVGRGYRTNAAGIEQLRNALGPHINVIQFDLPYWDGPDACLHLTSFISMVDHDLAVVYMPLMPVALVEALEKRGIAMVDIPAAEFATMAPNVLALGPRHCLMLDRNPITKQRLEDAGCEVETYVGNEMSLKAEGGATCLTQPVWRG